MFLIRPFLFFCISWAGIQTLFAQNTCSVQDSAQAEVFNQYAKQAEKAARWDSSVYYYQKSKQIFETANCPRGLVKILNNLSISYQRAEQPDNARIALLQAYALANQRLLDTDSLKGKTYQLIGMDYFQAQK
jgi:tetratricopeptide (TPR) repeat protein